MRNECGQVGLFLNSIEMMESGRCGRRKQRNPKRKNVENGENTEEIDEGTLDDNKNKIITDEQSQGEETDTENNSNHGNQQSQPDGKVSPETKPLLLKPQSTEEKVSAILKEIQSAAPDSTSDGDKGRGPQKRKHVEDAKIAELLNRQDTAVIYPEPCEDGDEQHNEGQVSEDEEVVLKCMHCSQTFLRAIVLRDHMREMHADKPLKFMCPKCDETFHQKSQLDKHLTLHSPTSQNCPVCNKLFANVYRLQRHMISHNESTDLRKFKCQECGKAFKFKHHLKEHVRIHSGEKPFICNNCGKRFSHSGSFSSHTTSKKCWGLSAHKNRLGVEGSQNLSQSASQPTSQSIGMFGQKIPLAFTGNKIQPQFERNPLQSVPITLAHQQHFLPAIYSQQKGTGTFFYPPAMFATPEGFLQPMFSVSQSIPTSLQQQSLNLTTNTKQVRQEQDTNKDTTSDSSSQAVSTTSIYGRSPRSLSPHSQSTRSFSPQSHSGRSVSPMSTSILSSPPSHPRRSVTPFSERAISHSPHSHSEQISPDVNSNTKLLITEKNKSDTSPIEQKETEDHSYDLDIKTEKLDTDNSEVKSETSESNSDSMPKKSPPTCQYCGEEFESPVVHHQHERYMCKLNKDIVQQRSQSEPCQSPHSTVSDICQSESSTLNGSISHDTDEEDVDELYKDNDISFDERKMRIRSLFTEEQQSYLKGEYLNNPRPKKHVLIQIGNKLGFPKRVIQVWFQNMRARERKQGREHLLGVSTVKTENAKDIEVPKSSTYIPNVPKPFPSLLSMSQQPQVQVCGQRVQSVGELPLDLTVRKSPPLAHGGLSRLSTPDRSSDDQALNLSVKKDSSEERENSRDRQTKTNDDNQAQQPNSLQDSAIFKYMQQKGLIQNKNIAQITSSVSPSLAHTLQNHVLHQSMASVLKMPAFSTSSEQKSTSSVLFEDPSSTSNSRFDHDSKLVIDEGMSEPSAAPNPKERQSPNAPVLLHVPLADPGLHEATHNLTTLAEAAQHAAAQHAANILSGKPKRLRKKTWRQMEAEEVQLELEDSLSNDEDHPSKKKRKSWKSHRLDRDEGMYACDQCNKVFSKQSSLARHKYEHSGARPFACDLCTKSFKHKHHLTEHKRLHSGEKPFQCKKCGKRFSHSGSFSQHMNHRYNYCSPNKTSDGDCELSSQDSP